MAPFYKQGSHLPLSCLVALNQMSLRRASSPQGVVGNLASSLPCLDSAAGSGEASLCPSLGAPAWLLHANTLPIQGSHSKASEFLSTAPAHRQGQGSHTH